jgi:hypothetical protein
MMGRAMAKVIVMDDYRNQQVLRAGFSHWRRKFTEHFNARTRLSDLGAATLSQLAEPGDGGSAALYGLIMGFLGYGPEVTFEALDSRRQSYVLDIQLFMVDQIRFEMMFRLGWLDGFIGNRFPLFEMVVDFERIGLTCQSHPPQLARNHPEYTNYRFLIDCDKQVFIRRMLPLALETFKNANGL